MIGTHFDTMGGISSVVKVYRAAGLLDRFGIRYLATHCDGGAWRKLQVAVKALLAFIWLLMTGQAHLVHIHSSSRASFWRKLPFFLLAHWTGRKTIFHIHSGAFDQFYDKCSPRRKAIIRYVFDHASRVIVLSETWRAWAQTISRNPHIVALYNPVQVPEGGARETGAARAILCLGRIGHNKGSFDLIGATAKLASAMPAVRLRLGGDGELERAAACAEELGIADRLDLLGWVTGPGKDQAVRSARVYALPSYSEGLPMSLLEAMAAGLPVVTTPVGGIPEAVTDGVEGYLIAPGDVDTMAARLASLLQDDALAERMGDAARRKIQTTFSTGAILPQLEAIYAELGVVATTPALRTTPVAEKQ